VARVKIRRKDLRQPDEFMELTGRVWQWLAANRGLAVAAGGVVVAVLAGAIGIQQYREYRLLDAADAFRKALVLLHDGETRAAAEAFGQVPAAGAYGALANLYRGQAALAAGDVTLATEAFRASAGHRGLPSYLRQQALVGLARALVRQGDTAAGLEQYQAAAGIPGPFQIDARLEAARLSEASGALEKARGYYEGALEEAYDAGAPFEDDLRNLVAWRLSQLPSKSPDATDRP
jgi:hypothetical protein